MDDLKFYEVTEDYINYLQSEERIKRGFTRVPNIGYDTNEKFVCGIVLHIKEFNYYAPISSFKKQQKSNILIKDTKNGQVLSSIRFSFMFPILDSELIYKNFLLEDKIYARLLNKEYSFCLKHYDDIKKKAVRVYNDVINKYNPKFNSDCCDFQLLEQKCKEYQLIKQEIQESQEQVAPIKE